MDARVVVDGLGPVAKTLLLPLYFRAVETGRRDGVLRASAGTAVCAGCR